MGEISGNGLTVVIIGASGDLARKKVIPALFALYCQGYLPERFCVTGFARSEMSDLDFRARIQPHLTCRYAPGEKCAERVSEFLSRCHYVPGQYDSVDSYIGLFQRLRQLECEADSNRLFYMSAPPFLYMPVARAMGNAGLVLCGDGEGRWFRAVVEKPFGRDRRSSDELVESLGQVFSEEQTYRIDHYLGKAIIQNLLVLRFTNVLFEPIWNSRFIESVRISWKEDIGVGERGGYFDQYGIIRDVMQNHLAQILALVAMEAPASLASADVSAAKTAALKAVAPAAPEDWRVGQYEAYHTHAAVPETSATPTFAAGVLRLNNERWKGTPFLLDAGKGLDERVAQIRVRFRRTECCKIMENAAGPLPPNELALRVQPDELIQIGINSRTPGLEMKLEQTWLNLSYKTAFEAPVPEAYESLLLDVIRGDRSLFITREELAAAWDIFTPLLHELEQRASRPVVYEFGSAGPGFPGVTTEAK